jgi:hypothetical protein
LEVFLKHLGYFKKKCAFEESLMGEMVNYMIVFKYFYCRLKLGLLFRHIGVDLYYHWVASVPYLVLVWVSNKEMSIRILHEILFFIELLLIQ